MADVVAAVAAADAACVPWSPSCYRFHHSAVAAAAVVVDADDGDDSALIDHGPSDRLRRPRLEYMVGSLMMSRLPCCRCYQAACMAAQFAPEDK